MSLRSVAAFLFLVLFVLPLATAFSPIHSVRRSTPQRTRRMFPMSSTKTQQNNDSPVVVVVGSANQDLTSYTAVLPAMGETVLGTSFETSCGGKGANQATAAASLGLAPVRLVCRLGQDDVFGQAVQDHLQAKQVQLDTKNCFVEGVSTGVASIVVDTKSGDNSIIVTPGANHKMTEQQVQDELEQCGKSVSAVVVQLEILQPVAHAALKKGHELGAWTILNPAPAPDIENSLDALFPVTDIIIPNETELRKLSGQGENTDFSEEEMAQALLDKGIRKAVIVTLGSRGAMVVTRDKDVAYVSQPDELPCKDDPIVDTIGAGDAFCGALATYLSVGVELEQAAGLACGFASMSIRRQGANYPSPDEIPDCLKVESNAAVSS